MTEEDKKEMLYYIEKAQEKAEQVREYLSLVKGSVKRSINDVLEEIKFLKSIYKE